VSRPKLSNEGQWFDFVVEQKELAAGQFLALATT
jgi:hypothetical protein